MCRQLEAWDLGRFIPTITSERRYRINPRAPSTSTSRAAKSFQTAFQNQLSVTAEYLENELKKLEKFESNDINNNKKNRILSELNDDENLNSNSNNQINNNSQNIIDDYPMKFLKSKNILNSSASNLRNLSSTPTASLFNSYSSNLNHRSSRSYIESKNESYGENSSRINNNNNNNSEGRIESRNISQDPLHQGHTTNTNQNTNTNMHINQNKISRRGSGNNFEHAIAEAKLNFNIIGIENDISGNGRKNNGDHTNTDGNNNNNNNGQINRNSLSHNNNNNNNNNNDDHVDNNNNNHTNNNHTNASKHSMDFGLPALLAVFDGHHNLEHSIRNLPLPLQPFGVDIVVWLLRYVRTNGLISSNLSLLCH